MTPPRDGLQGFSAWATSVSHPPPMRSRETSVFRKGAPPSRIDPCNGNGTYLENNRFHSDGETSPSLEDYASHCRVGASSSEPKLCYLCATASPGQRTNFDCIITMRGIQSRVISAVQFQICSTCKRKHARYSLRDTTHSNENTLLRRSSSTSSDSSSFR